MSMETRSSSALFKRAEQLKRWEESDTNRESASPKGKPRKVKFSSGCVFLAACAAGDKDEVLRLLEKGADINTTNVDGLTALHQACIDDNLDMVEFLVENGADVNRGDNEGWTPLHATASCGFISIAKYLIESGANVAAVNNDGELPIDIAECEQMEDLLQAEIEEQGIDCNSARLEEERLMLKDARDWMAAKSPQIDMAHSKTGATPLHVASAKGYIKVMKLLLQCGADVDKQDVDGWTPLHAAAHWGQKEAAQLLAENLADMDCKNYVGQTPFDVADTDMFRFLDDLKKRQNKEEVLQRRQAKKRAEMQDKAETETPSKVKKVEVAIEEGVKNINNNNNNNNNNGGVGVGDDVEKKNMVNSLNKQKDNNIIASNNTEAPKGPPAPAATPSPPAVPPKPHLGGDATVPPSSTDDNNVPTWRKPPPSKPPAVVTKVDSHATSKTASFKDKSTSDVNNENDVSLRRTNSFQNDPEFYTRYQALRARIQASSDPTHYSFPYDSQSKYIIAPSNKNRQQNRHQDKEDAVSVSSTSTVNSVTTSTSSTPTNTSLSPTTSPLPNSQPVRSGLKLPVGANAPPAAASTANTNTSAISPSSGGNRLTVIKNFFKSFVPPVRDEESETQRKAHAKRVRETRRSTQGVTLEEIKSAEQLVKKKNQSTTNAAVNTTANNEQPIGNGKGEPTTNNGISVTATITTATTTVPTPRASEELAQPVHERRPSWRLRVDNGSKFKLEDATKDDEPPPVPSFLRRPAASSAPIPRPASAPVETAETTVTLPLRRPKSQEEREQDKESDARNAQATLATQAAIQRRRRPKRRSTGVVAFDNLDDLDPSKETTGGGDAQENSNVNNDESGTEKSNRSSRLGSASDLVLRGENGEIDYKRLYEQTLADNDRLKDKLRKTEDELKDTKQTLERINTVTSKNSLSELEKRERRAMERKLSEMEEELKQLQKLKAENERLRAENRALTRVVSKLTNSAKK